MAESFICCPATSARERQQANHVGERNLNFAKSWWCWQGGAQSVRSGKVRGADNFSTLFVIAELYGYVCVCTHMHMYIKFHFVV